MILAAGFAVWWRRGWRPAVFHTAPLGLAYAVWYVWAGASLNDLLATRARLFVIIPGTDISAHSATVPSLTIGAFGRFMWTTGSSLFQGLGYFTVLAFALVALLIVGVVVAWKSTAPSRRARRFGMSGGLLIGAVVGAAAAAPQRAWLGPDAAAASRYVGVTAAMVLPILAVAADALMLRWRPLIPVVVVLFLLPALGNISLLGADAGLGPGYYRTLETWIGSLPHYRDFDKVPAWVTPNDTVLGTPGVSVGWLRRAEKQGKLPPPQQLDPPTLSAVAIQLGVAQRGGAAPPNAVCRTYDKPLALDPTFRRRLAAGDPGAGVPPFGTKSAGALTMTPTPLTAARPGDASLI